MARNRLNLQTELEGIPGIKGVYYNPPESVKLKYDCIVYSLSGVPSDHADDIRYINHKAYELILISRNPDCAIVDTLLGGMFKYIRFDRAYVSDNLHHWAYTLYY